MSNESDMETNSILDMPSDIDELEKAKAIESIVLESSTVDNCVDDFEESDVLMGPDSSVNVTSSLYDADESLKSTDVENGSESTELKEKDLDSLDGEQSTSIVEQNEACIQSNLQLATQSKYEPVSMPISEMESAATSTQQTKLPSPQQQLQEHQERTPSKLNSLSHQQLQPNQVIVTKPVVSSSVPTSPQSNKVIYVKLIPKTSVQSVVATVSQSPPKSIPLTSMKTKHEKPVEKAEAKKVSPIKLAFEEPTTSNVGSSSAPKPIGHTVNLLNNNRILIKSVKNNHSNSTQMPASTMISKSTVNDASATSSSSKIPMKEDDDCTNRIDVKSDFQNVVNVKLTENVNQSDASEVKCSIPIMNNGNIETNDLEIKKEQLLNENSMESSSDMKPLDTTIDDTNLLSAQKIKREFEQLQKTVNESKVLSEFVIEHNKRSRRPTKSGKSKHKHNNITVDANVMDEKMSVILNREVSPSSSSVRSASKESDRSATSSFTGSAAKRNTRSMNTDFSAKQKKFLKGIQQMTRGTDDETDNNSGVDDDDDDLDYYARQQTTNITERRKSIAVKNFGLDSKTGWDKYCWKCHQLDTNLFCSCCIRSYHANCLKMKVLSPSEMNKWQCPERIEIKAAEKENKKKKFDVKHFNKLLKYAMNRILQDSNLQQFQFPVNKTQNPGYSDVIVNPINLSKIENNIDNLVYTNSEAFLSDIKWILHNCSIYFSDNYKVTRAAKSLQKVSKQEVNDIETCPECYLNANTMTDNWFTETCAKPHLILWAKLKGFPYWPAKAMSINSTLVDVRFFGEHDRANIPSKDCYLYSREDPNPPTNKYKRNTIADCVKEVDIYIENIKAKYGAFNYAELKTPFNPQMADQHLVEMIPGLRSARGRRRSSTARSDLTLKIVKTADNNLSVVKKDQIAKELPQVKRTVDITGDGAVSRTPTPPSAVLKRRQTSDTRIKRSKSTNRHSDGKLTALDHKSYQVMRRKSMAVEKLGQKRMSAVQSLNLNSSNESTDTSFIEHTPKSTNETVETESVTKKTNKTAAKKRKLSVDHIKSTEMIETPEKNSKLDSSKAVSLSKDEKERSEEEVEVNILRSVGLMKKTSATRQHDTPSTGKTIDATAKGKNSTCDKNKTNEKAAATRPRDGLIQEDGSTDDSPLVLVPFIEVKKETESETSTKKTNIREQTPTSSQATVSISSSNDNTPNKNGQIAEDNLSNIKTETSSDDDSLMIIDDDSPSRISNSTTSTKQMQCIDEILERRGLITVRDLSEMTSQQQARKSFPKGNASVLKPRNNAVNKSAPMNNMVCIPLDGLPRLDVTYNSSQPPPLSVVGSGNSVSLLTNNQPLSTSSTSITNLSNGPPQLSITTIPTSISGNQSATLLTSNIMTTLSNGTITKGMASAVTDLLARRQPPQLSARPTAPLRSDGDTVFPSEAGSVCKTLMENAHKMTDFFRTVIEDTLSDLSNMSNPEARIRILELELEKERNLRQKDGAENKANYERMLTEMKKNMDKERARAINEVRKQCEMERIRSVEEAKRKQWCANCLKEAQFYCCWNTSYCNHNCQRKHWEQHMNSCAQLESTQNVQNQRKATAKSQTKTELRSQQQPHLAVHSKQQASAQKDNSNISSHRSGTRTTNNSVVPALRNILPKNSMVSLNTSTTQSRHSNQSVQSQSKQAPNSQCIILGRPISNWANSTYKSASLLHSNAILFTSSQPYATLTNVAPSSSGVSLLNTTQSQKPIPNETIIIP